MSRVQPFSAALAFSVLAISALWTPHARAVTLVYTNDVLGELEPCGCRQNPYGGMVRKAGLLSTLGDEELVQLDGGDLLFSSDVIPEPLKKQAEVQAGYELRAMDRLKHDAAVPGEKDFALGVGKFDELRRKSKVKFLAANLSRKRGGTWLEGTSVFTRKDKSGKSVRVGVIGLVGEKLAWPSQLKASPAIETARRLVPALRRRSDIVIALTHQGYDADLALAKAVPGIDLIVGGHSQSFLQEPTVVSRDDGAKTWVFQSSFRNQYVGLLPLQKPFDLEKHQLVGLDAGYDEKATPTVTDMKKLVSEFKAAVAAANSEATEPKLERVESASAAASAAQYQTFPRCAECHWKQFDFWRKTPHGAALDALVGKEQLRNKECLSCHTVGFGQPHGFSELNQVATRRVPGAEPTPLALEDLAGWLSSVHGAGSLKDKVKLTRVDPDPLPIKRSVSQIDKSFAPVQCENCHVGAGDHPFSGGFKKTVAQDACLHCHTAQMAPKWYTGSGQPDWKVIADKRAKMTCPAGDLPPED